MEDGSGSLSARSARGRGTLFSPIRPMLLIPNGARARDQPSRNVSFQSISRLITLDLAHYQPAMAVCNIRQRVAGSVVPFENRSTDSARSRLSGKSIFAGMPSCGQQVCHRPLYGSGSEYREENHHSLPATVFANFRLTSHARSWRRDYTRPSA